MITLIPMIKRRIVGVKLPDSGVAKLVGVAEAVGVLVVVGVRLAVGVGVSLVVGVAEGVEVKAGAPDASTTKVRVKERRMPAASRH